MRSTDIPTYQNAFLIYNPKAGKFQRNEGEMLRKTEAALSRCGHFTTALATKGPATAAGLARDCVERGADLIIAAGGDGTINEVANGVVGTDVPFAILPGGTANVMAAELGIGQRIVPAAERLGDWLVERVAVGQLNNARHERYFLMMAGAGLDAQIVYNIDAALKARIGKAAYWISGFSQLGKPLPEFDVRVNGHTHRCSFALASRVRNYGGDLWIARGASLFSNYFEVVLFEGAHSMPYVKYLVGVLAGALPRMRGVSVLRANQVTFECPEDRGIYVHIDGEFAGRLPVTLSIVPQALSLLVPATFRNSHLTANG